YVVADDGRIWLWRPGKRGAHVRSRQSHAAQDDPGREVYVRWNSVAGLWRVLRRATRTSAHDASRISARARSPAGRCLNRFLARTQRWYASLADGRVHHCTRMAEVREV